MGRKVRYCTTEDGVRIAYCVEGEGPPLLVVPYFIDSFSLEHLAPEEQAFWRRLGEGRRLIRYDMRGIGLSQRAVADLSLTGLVRDLEAVVRAAGLQRFSLFAATAGGPPAIQYAASHPESVRRLILYGTCARIMDIFPAETYQGLAALCRGNWPLAAQTFADVAGRTEIPGTLVPFGNMNRESATGDVVARWMGQIYPADVTEFLPTLGMETLVLHRLHDPIFAFILGQALAAQIPRARFVPLEGTIHAVMLGDSQAALDAINAFLDEEPETCRRLPADMKERQGPLRTVLFTDIVGHTEMMSRLGDEQGRVVLREHERITREVLKAHGGTEVKTMGDGFMASFGSVTRAVECAIGLQRAFDGRNRAVGARHTGSREADASSEGDGEQNGMTIAAGASPLHVRCGINAGEQIEEEGPDGRSDLFGATVILAARIAGRADGGEILVADTVRGLCSGKGFLFSDRGEFVAKGFEEPVRVYAVRWQES